MTQKEFEERTKLRLSVEEFQKVHALYMACGDEVNKDEFCRMYLSGDWKALLDDVMEGVARTKETMKIIVEFQKMACEELQKEEEKREEKKMELAKLLIGKAYAYSDTDFHREAVRLIGEREVVFAKIEMGFPLWEEDQEYVNKNLK